MNANYNSETIIRFSRIATCGLVALVLLGSLFGFAEGQQTTSGSSFDGHRGTSNTPSIQASNSNVSSNANAVAEQHEVKTFDLSARFHLVDGKRNGVLILKADIPSGSYIYALTQSGNPPPSKIKVEVSDQFKITGKFSADRHPKVIEKDPVFGNRLEKHTKTVQFFVPIELAAGVKPESVQPQISFDGQVCSEAGSCMPIRNREVTAQFAGYFAQESKKRTNSQNTRR